MRRIRTTSRQRPDARTIGDGPHSAARGAPLSTAVTRRAVAGRARGDERAVERRLGGGDLPELRVRARRRRGAPSPRRRGRRRRSSVAAASLRRPIVSRTWPAPASVGELAGEDASPTPRARAVAARRASTSSSTTGSAARGVARRHERLGEVGRARRCAARVVAVERARARASSRFGGGAAGPRARARGARRRAAAPRAAAAERAAARRRAGRAGRGRRTRARGGTPTSSSCLAAPCPRASRRSARAGPRAPP